jgi:hypothetical protein
LVIKVEIKMGGGYKPYKEFLFKISETAKVNHFNILVDLCHKSIGKSFWWYKFPYVYEIWTACLEQNLK